MSSESKYLPWTVFLQKRSCGNPISFLRQITEQKFISSFCVLESSSSIDQHHRSGKEKSKTIRILSMYFFIAFWNEIFRRKSGKWLSKKKKNDSVQMKHLNMVISATKVHVDSLIVNYKYI